MNSIFEPGFIEIDEEADAILGDLQICQQLSGVDRKNNINGLYLDYNFIVHQKVDSETAIEL